MTAMIKSHCEDDGTRSYFWWLLKQWDNASPQNISAVATVTGAAADVHVVVIGVAVGVAVAATAATVTTEIMELRRLRKCSCCSTVMSPPVISSRVQWHVHLKSWNVILTLLAPEISPTALAFTWRHHKNTGSKVRSPSSRTSLICISVSFHF